MTNYKDKDFVTWVQVKEIFIQIIFFYSVFIGIGFFILLSYWLGNDDSYTKGWNDSYSHYQDITGHAFPQSAYVNTNCYGDNCDLKQ